ncbi:AAA domain-containing protein [Deinococcus hopiensis]|uniref:AAA domain-containing protein n=1 Tax=Deinococcus hopiensis KR-140 TaxID=695939 RepID=A0A1W1VLD2_9DEIO|nr:AAA domain-containing protein [Deinococcus hopiensis]SMB94167.1 AAA domain-containing protein [Deinococcus hopiensis KR-140]
MHTSLQHEQIRNVFQYLKEFTGLKYKPQRTDRGDALIWLHTLPDDKRIVNAGRQQPEELDEDWLVIHKPRFAPAPKRPDLLTGWVDGPLDQPDHPPVIRSERLMEKPDLEDNDEEEAVQGTVLLREQPEVLRAWAAYEGLWSAWAEGERRSHEVQRHYSQLFDFHQKLSAESERYELRLGLGHLTWRAAASGEVRRHLLTARASLEFDPLQGVLSVRAAGDGAGTTLEQDMLDAEDRVGPAVQQAIQAALKEGGDDLWSGQTLPALLETWVNAVGDRGRYENDLRPVVGSPDHPTVHWAPALLLRRRGERSLLAAYDSILTQLDTAPALPDSMRRFLGDRSPQGQPAGPPSADKTLYFPKAANEAQRDIIRRLQREQGVLVQGPPGTGKSHTIVNLVSHLLATDQKVLVTSHTARALKVLRDQFPAELQGLCITHLLGEEGAQAALQGSVGELLYRFTNRHPEQEDAQEQLLFSRLERARQQEDQLLNTLQQIREAETGHLTLFGYQGTAQQIGARLRAEEGEFEWLNDLTDAQRDVPLTNAEAVKLLSLLRDVSPEEIFSLNLARPDPEDLARPEDFLRFVQAEERAARHAASQGEARASSAYPALERATSEARRLVTQRVEALLAAAETERGRPASWVPGAVEALLKEQGGRWQEIARQSGDALPTLLERVEQLEQPVSGLDGRDRLAVEGDAKVLLEHLTGGGNWGNLLFKPAAVKTRQYLRTDVKVNGRAADAPDALRALLEHFSLSARLDQIRALWASQGVTVSGPLRLQVTELEEHRQTLARVLKLRALLEEAQRAVRAISGLPQPQWWEPQALRDLIAAANAAEAAEDVRISRDALDALLPRLHALKAGGRPHDVTVELIRAIEGRDADAYGRAYLQVQHLVNRMKLASLQSELMSRLHRAAPALAHELKITFAESFWDARLASFEAAWNWVRADLRLTELANPDTEVEVREQLATARQEQNQMLGELAAIKAWRNTLNRMTANEQAALVLWQQAVRRIGKGTGKQAGKWRQVAQDALSKARSAIPAWIMPIHLVAENFAISPGMFDVVIVDEASQAGPEALFLTFIAKKIVIVGDDKQIEPDGVGISIAQVNALEQQYLKGVAGAAVIADPKASLFGFGGYAYPGRLSLREHFRCMPEIIKFSSDLSYADTPLIALRQFGSDRLPPLMPCKVEGGYTLPKGDKVNPVEARAIVDQIKECLADPKYAGKSFGVISLLGSTQAVEISRLLRAEIGEAEIVDRKLTCGDAYTFQGTERDVIFLSMVASPSEGGREMKVGRDSPTFQSRYNVAVSRARDQLWLYHSVDVKGLHPEDLRASLIQHMHNPEVPSLQPLKNAEVDTLRELARRPGRANSPRPAPFDSWFEVDVYLDLVNRGYRVVPQYKLAGYSIDLVVEGLRGRLAVECDGDYWHGPDQYRKDLARQQTLERVGMEFWRVRGSTYARDPEAALQDLWQTLSRRGVFPDGDPRNFQVSQDASATPPGKSPSNSQSTAQQGVSSAIPAVQDAGQQDTTQVLPPVSSSTTSVSDTSAQPATNVFLQPYVRWTQRPLPDPRTLSNLDPVAEGLQAIVEVEGPMTARQAYQLYCQAAGVRFGQTTKSLLNKATTRALKAGHLLAADEWGTPGVLDKVIRVPDSPAVRLREAGPRKLSDVPPSELAALMAQLVRLEPGLGKKEPEELYRGVLATFGAQRLTENAREVLDRAHVLYQQPG